MKRLTGVAALLSVVIIYAEARGQLNLIQSYEFTGGNLSSSVGSANTATLANGATLTNDAVAVDASDGEDWIAIPFTTDRNQDWSLTFDFNLSAKGDTNTTVFMIRDSANGTADQEQTSIHMNCNGNAGPSCAANGGLIGAALTQGGFDDLWSDGEARFTSQQFGNTATHFGQLDIIDSTNHTFSLEYDAEPGGSTLSWQFDGGGDPTNGGVGPHVMEIPAGVTINAGLNELTLGGGNLSGLTGSYDNVQIFSAVGGGPDPGVARDFTWNADNLGDWAGDSWNVGTGSAPPVGMRANNPNHRAVFGGLITTPTTVVTNAPVTLNRVEFANTTNGYIIAGHGSLTMEATTDASPDDPSMSVQGTHRFQAAVNLLNDTATDVATDSTLIFDGALSLMGNIMTKTGAGTLAINNNLLTAGGTLNCSEGTCSGSGTIGGDLNNDGGTISPGNSAAITGNQVPEPGTLALLLVGGLLGFWAWRRQRTN